MCIHKYFPANTPAFLPSLFVLRPVFSCNLSPLCWCLTVWLAAYCHLALLFGGAFSHENSTAGFLTFWQTPTFRYTWLLILDQLWHGLGYGGFLSLIILWMCLISSPKLVISELPAQELSCSNPECHFCTLDSPILLTMKRSSTRFTECVDFRILRYLWKMSTCCWWSLCDFTGDEKCWGMSSVW